MKLPTARGELSAAVIDVLGGGGQALPAGLPGDADPYGDDVQLALYLCYELHYRGIEGVDDRWEWDPELLRLRGALERRFLDALRADVPVHPDVASALDELLAEPVNGTGVSHFLCDEGEKWHLREYAALRSLYHLKEADPHVWAVPRLTGRAKAGLVAVEYDEFGAGRADRVHAKLFADLMADLGLDPGYGRYLEAGTAEVLATVNLMSLFGLHRSLRGALVGHFAAVEITSSPGSRRLAQAMERTGAGPAAVHFYAEHVEADAVHEQVVRREVVGGLLADEPGREPDVVFGLDATGWLEDRLADRLLTAWRAGESAVRVPL
ncbi:iron-containing redox enzyme family protein [Streptomyces sp. URMC 129]|uniref:iron-containing redox enzyme family protein n=1 Tax=Streptomyces sp. URMC 129 TaxID=3423407 RepID=UPI003F1DDE27